MLLIDAMGMLRMCYQLSDMAIVGGSYTDKVGGHNILEPCCYAKPVLFGPHMDMQLELVNLVIHYGAGFQVHEKDLKAVLSRWIKNPEEREEMGQKGLRLIQDLKGSTQSTVHALNPLVHKLEMKTALR